ncbi:glycine cleavage system aminomethyltransferase GcvT [Coxiella endosymbiont of Amblyomma sculptum]|nr:glycine cleavage system aminomethyltransferase GcvT [Coxiella endosymbiont of Amblyomma sculptum]
MLRRTPLYKEHSQRNARFVNFSGWEMPLHYGSQIGEHCQVRKKVGIFDVSHMGVIDIKGKNATPFLRFLLANDIIKLKESPGYALYSCMLNETGGVIDDLIIYCLFPSHYRMVVNAGTQARDIVWMKEQSRPYQVSISQQSQICIIAIQGPSVFSVTRDIFGEAIHAKLMKLRSFRFVLIDELLIARTGYTGEDGLEIIVPNVLKARRIWRKAMRIGITPCGLGARNTLRLEAGLNLYGFDMDETTSPFSSNLDWSVTLDDPDRNFVGRSILEYQLNTGIKEQLVGLTMEGPGIFQNHQKVWLSSGDDFREGKITSSGFSPVLKCAIAFARISKEEFVFRDGYVERRGKKIPVKVVGTPFVYQGKKLFEERK